MSTAQWGGMRYWDRCVHPDGDWRIDPVTKMTLQPPYKDLAAMRAGLGRAAVSVPALWPYYTCKTDDNLALQGKVSVDQEAEHAALALFGLHQDRQSTPMHKRKIHPGAALRSLRSSGGYGVEMLDRRVGAAMTSTSVRTLLGILQGLVELLRAEAQPLDYNLLMKDIQNWHHIPYRTNVRRIWGLSYYVWGGSSDGDLDAKA